MLETNKQGLVHNKACCYCRSLAVSLNHYVKTDRDGAEEIRALRSKLEAAERFKPYARHSNTCCHLQEKYPICTCGFGKLLEGK